MFKSIKYLSVSLFLMMAITTSTASSKFKHKKVDKECLNATHCPIDSSAYAYYIFDDGNTIFEWNDIFNINYKRHFRIKILDEKAFDLASFEIALFTSNDGKYENVGGIKAYTYNLENNKISTTKLDSKDIIREKKDKYWDIVKFDLPNVKKGSVIDVTYTGTSQYLHMLPTWYFQREIPVLKSQYSIEIPVYFTYKHYPYIDIPVETEQNESSGSIRYSLDTDFNFSTEILSYEASNVPAVKDSSTLSPLTDKASRIEYSLTSTFFPKTAKNAVMGEAPINEEYFIIPDWYDIYHIFNTSIDFSHRISEKNILKKEVASLQAQFQDSTLLMKSAFELISNQIKWDGTFAPYSLHSITETMEKEIGNSADINLALVALLQRLGLEANAVVIKTRDKGFLRQYTPTITQFNHVVAACKIKGELVFMDASSKNTGLGELTKACQNGQGLLIGKDAPQWVDLEEIEDEENE